MKQTSEIQNPALAAGTKKIFTRQHVCRFLFYILGMMVLASGIILNTKAALGVPPITSVATTFSLLLNVNLGNTTLVQYLIFIVVEVVLHIVMYRQGRLPRGLKLTLVLDVLQIAVSILFTRLMNVLIALIPSFATDFPGSFLSGIPFRFVILIIAVILTGFGAAMVLDTRLIPAPSDGIVQVIADAARKPTGLTKNIFDILNVAVSLVIGLAATHSFFAVNVGTVVAVLGVGRAVALFNHMFKFRLDRLTGLDTAG